MKLTRLFAIGLIGAAFASTAQAQNVVDRANAAAAGGLSVLKVHPDHGRFRGPAVGVDRNLLQQTQAIPVPHVMNGGGFGYTGFDYYSDATTEGTLRGGKQRANNYILAPAFRAPLQ